MRSVTIAQRDETYWKMPPAVFQVCHDRRPDAFDTLDMAVVGTGVAVTAWTIVPVEFSIEEFDGPLRVGSAMMLPGARILPKISSMP